MQRQPCEVLFENGTSQDVVPAFSFFHEGILTHLVAKSDPLSDTETRNFKCQQFEISKGVKRDGGDSREIDPCRSWRSLGVGGRANYKHVAPPALRLGGCVIVWLRTQR